MTQTFLPSPRFTRCILGYEAFFMIDLDFVRDFDGDFFSVTVYNTTDAINEISEAHYRGFRLSGTDIFE